MRVLQAALAAAMTVASVAIIAGCSGNTSTMPHAVTSTTNNASHVTSNHADRSGVAPKFLSLLKFGSAKPAVHSNALAQRLAVTDFGTASTEILNKNYKMISSVSDAAGPDGDWYDHLGNLYVADYAGVGVYEYAYGSTTPSFHYTGGLGDPINVTTGENGHVFVADYNFGGDGFVNEYAQGSNTVINSCHPGGAAEGLAIGERGQVFVSYNGSDGFAHIAEYKTGLTGCHEKVFPFTMGFAGGMQEANDGTLVAEDQFVGVNLIPKPYTSIASTINPGYSDPFHVALDKKNLTMYVADVGNGEVWVQTYPAGTVVTTLAGGNTGIVDPAGVARLPFEH